MEGLFNGIQQTPEKPRVQGKRDSGCERWEKEVYTRPAKLVLEEVKPPKPGKSWANLDERPVHAVKVMVRDHTQTLDLGVFRVVLRHFIDARNIFVAMAISASKQLAHVCQKGTPGLRGRADVNCTRDPDGAGLPTLEVEPSIALNTSTALPARSACVSEDAPVVRGRADVNRARDLDGAASTRRMCVRRHTWCGR